MHTMRVVRGFGYTGVRSTPYAPSDLGPDGGLVLGPDPSDDQEMGNMDPPAATPATRTTPTRSTPQPAPLPSSGLPWGLVAFSVLGVVLLKVWQPGW